MEPSSTDVMYKLGAIETAVLNTNTLIERHIEEDKKFYTRVYDLEIARAQDQAKQKANGRWTATLAGLISFIIATAIGIAQAVGLGR